MKTAFALALAMTAGLSLPASADNSIELINQTGWDIHEIYMSPSSQDDWGDDYLGSEILETGDSLTVTDVASGQWDLRIVDMDGDECMLTDVHITASESVSISAEDLVGCQE